MNSEINIEIPCESTTIDEIESEDPVPGTAGPEMFSPIVKLDVDCFEELFEWLSLSDLRTLRQTCKRLQQVVDHFIRTNYPAGRGIIKLDPTNFRPYRINPANNQFLQELKIITEFKTSGINLTASKIEIFKAILPEIEKCTIWETFEGEFYESFLKWCTNLKCLRIGYYFESEKIIGSDNSWLLRKYPSLKHIELSDNFSYFVDCKIDELEIFFKSNPNIQIFSTNLDFLFQNRDCFLKSDIKIGRIDLDCDDLFNDSPDEVCQLINELYDRGFYKRVHIYVKCIGDEECIHYITSVHGMERLSFIEMKGTLPLMQDLRELATYGDEDFSDFETIVKNLENLERVYMKYAKSNAIIPFLRYGPRVKEIKISKMENDLHFKNGIIDLAALNKERSKLAGASKVTIYVEEHIFLATKFALSNTELSLVKLKRAEAVEWIQQFDYDY